MSWDKETSVVLRYDFLPAEEVASLCCITVHNEKNAFSDGIAGLGI